MPTLSSPPTFIARFREFSTETVSSLTSRQVTPPLIPPYSRPSTSPRTGCHAFHATICPTVLQLQRGTFSRYRPHRYQNASLMHACRYFDRAPPHMKTRLCAIMFPIHSIPEILPVQETACADDMPRLHPPRLCLVCVSFSSFSFSSSAYFIELLSSIEILFACRLRLIRFQLSAFDYLMPRH